MLDFERFEHLYDARMLLETDAARKLCAAAPHESLVTLKKIWLVPPSSAARTGSKSPGSTRRFHAALVAAAGNPELARMHADVTERIRIVRRLDFTQSERVQANLRRACRHPARGSRPQTPGGDAAACARI